MKTLISFKFDIFSFAKTCRCVFERNILLCVFFLFKCRDEYLINMYTNCDVTWKILSLDIYWSFLFSPPLLHLLRHHCFIRVMSFIRYVSFLHIYRRWNILIFICILVYKLLLLFFHFYLHLKKILFSDFIYNLKMNFWG